MSPIPWAAILTHGPTLVAAARSLLADQSRKTTEHHRGIDARLDQLEKASVESARLLQQMAEQLQALTLAQQEAERRIRIVLIVGSVAAALSLAAVIVAIIS